MVAAGSSSKAQHYSSRCTVTAWLLLVLKASSSFHSVKHRMTPTDPASTEAKHSGMLCMSCHWLDYNM
jgi:hypothetical protein